jgi:hypothetical protein
LLRPPHVEVLAAALTDALELAATRGVGRQPDLMEVGDAA